MTSALSLRALAATSLPRKPAPITASFGRPTSRLEAVRLTDGTRIEADVAVVALGAVPNTEWLEGSFLRLEPGVVW